MNPTDPHGGESDSNRPAPASVDLKTKAQSLRRAIRLMWQWVGAPILGGLIGLILVGRIGKMWEGPDHYTIYFVGDIHRPSITKMRDGLKAEIAKTPLKVDGRSIEIAEIDDEGDPDRAAQVAKVLADEPDTLFVVGHGYSSTSKAAMPMYLAADEPVPVILPTETNPTVLPAVSKDKFLPVYRLAPSDHEQAIAAAQFGTKKLDARSFWVISDPENPVYSKYLANNFISAVHSEPGRTVVLATSAGPAFPPDFPKALKVSCAFFAGDWSSALTVVHQLRKLTPETKILLSDAAADSQLLRQGDGDMEDVHVFHPRSADEISKSGYEMCGRDSGFIAATLIKEAGQRFDEIRRGQNLLGHALKWALNIHRVSDSRAAVRRVMEEHTHGVEFKGTPSGETYRFNYHGVAENQKFHIWQVEDGRFVERRREDR